MRPKVVALSFMLLAWPAALVQPIGAQEQPQSRPDWHVRMEAGLLSASLNRVPADEVFGAIAEQGKLVIQLDRTLLTVPLTDRFERLPLEQGLRRLIGLLQSQNFRIDFVGQPGGEPRVERVEILAASGPQEVQTFSAARADQAANGGKGKKDRPLNPGEQRRFEENGGFPGVPKGLQRKAERGGRMPPGNGWRFERAAQILGTDPESLVKREQEQAPSGFAEEGGGAR